MKARMCVVLIFFGVCLCTMMSQMTSHALHRHLLHQPFFPLVSPPSPPFHSAAHPPSLPPQPSHYQPNYPFSSSSATPANAYPFFPSDSYSPPPPSPPPAASLPSFPANISSLVFPNSSSGDAHISTRLIATIVSISVSALLSILLLALILHRRKRHNGVVSLKPLRSASMERSPTSTVTSDGTIKPPPLRAGRGIIGTSTEFLYLGSVVNSQEIDQPNSVSNNNVTKVIFLKPDSPELRPLPPLPKYNYFTSGEQVGSSRNIEAEDDEEFFSPRGLSVDKERLRQTEPGSRKVRRLVEDQILADGNLNSRTVSFPSSNSTSPTISLSDHCPTLVLSSPSLSSSPEIELGRSRILPTRVSDVVGTSSPEKFVDFPPAAPPMPPPRFRETAVSPMGINFLDEVVVDANYDPGDCRGGTLEKNEETPTMKLKPLHWDKVHANSDRATVWDHIKSSSFQLNEELIKSLFMVNSTKTIPIDRGFQNVLPSPNQENRVLDSRRSQNIAILLRALNVTTDEVYEALLEGNLDTLGSELLESLLKMKPSEEEEQKLREFNDESPLKLGPAEKFLKVLLEIPFAFERMDAMLYMAKFDSEVEYLTRTFQTLEAACDELKTSKMFLKLLEAVLQAGNRMNVGTDRGDALAFKLDTLLKLVDIKGTDGKTTLLHFVVQEIIRDEDPINKQGDPFGFQNEVESRKRSLQVVTSLIGELSDVKKAAEIDFSILSSEIEKLASQISKVSQLSKLVEDTPADEKNPKFEESIKDFLKKAELEISMVQNQRRAAFSMVKEVTEYFHGNCAKEEAHPFRIFLVVRDFLSILDKVCKDVGKRNERTIVGSGSAYSSFPQCQNIPHVLPHLMRQSSDLGD
uniref:Formin-like protein n=1 Tax=Kalanchoe fedtschenkoi TaxID=63787 RepID=A0A7N0U0I5_KALFE